MMESYIYTRTDALLEDYRLRSGWERQDVFNLTVDAGFIPDNKNRFPKQPYGTVRARYISLCGKWEHSNNPAGTKQPVNRTVADKFLRDPIQGATPFALFAWLKDKCFSSSISPSYRMIKERYEHIIKVAENSGPEPDTQHFTPGTMKRHASQELEHASKNIRTSAGLRLGGAVAFHTSDCQTELANMLTHGPQLYGGPFVNKPLPPTPDAFSPLSLMHSDYDKRSGINLGQPSAEDLEKAFVDIGWGATPSTSTNSPELSGGHNRQNCKTQSSASAYTNMSMPMIDEGTVLNSNPFEGFPADAATHKSSSARKTYSLGKDSGYVSGTTDELAAALRGQLNLDPTHEVVKYKDGAKKLWLGFPLEKEHDD
ncbi:uncharacterized protein PAC_11953 [Phialocephala subalpina]|uniref:Uncharacterized protein n=1 Tax=Phialocephala subalpina TaxID=576137 RepID=A0A1L7XAP2_9HELO|nr:uncharacterized protein PAC_11953 [Phialocephala subalpina]